MPLFRLPRWLPPALIVALGFAAYADSLRGPFIFDDVYSIEGNPGIRHWRGWGQALSASAQAATVQGRPVLGLSLAANYAVGGLRPFGYHLVNLLIHLAAGLVVYGIVRRTLECGRLSARFGPAAQPLALAVALLWTVHPIQTESVTYTIQRAESLMGLFYLLTLYCYIRYAEGRPAFAKASAGDETGRNPWAWLSILACLVGMGTKEVMVSAPVMVLLYDRAFLSGSLAQVWRTRGRLLLALAATWIPLSCWVAATGGNRGGSVGFGLKVPWTAYWLTQGKAIVHYLRLTFWPHPLVFAYGTFWVRPGWAAVSEIGAVVALVLATALAWRRFPGIGFLGTWFFAILAPTSLLPGTSEMIVEHRMYLALLAPVALTIVAGYAWSGPRSLAVWPAAAIVLAGLTFLRNRDYRSEVSIWTDTVAKRPFNSVAHYGLGHALALEPAAAERAIAELRTAIRLYPDFFEAHDLLGLVLRRDPAHLPEALAEFRQAVAINPRDFMAMDNLGSTFLDVPGGAEDAIAHLEQARRLAPDYPTIRINLGRAHDKRGRELVARAGRENEALAEFREAVRLDPANAGARSNLGMCLAFLPGRQQEGMAELREALRIDPSLLEARYNLGVILSETPGRRAEAMAEFQDILRRHPDFGPARDALNKLLP